jgi:hypothetical protein
MRKFGPWIISMITILSCSNKDNEIIGEKLTKCYQQKFLDENLAISDPIEYYQKLENYLIENKYLKGRTKKDYSDFWDDIYDSTKVISIKDFAREHGMTVMTMNYPRSGYCYYDLVEQQRINDNQLQQVQALIDQMDEIGDIGDIELNKKVIEITDEKRFDKIVFRIPTLTYMYLTIEARNWRRYGR